MLDLIHYVDLKKVLIEIYNKLGIIEDELVFILLTYSDNQEKGFNINNVVKKMSLSKTQVDAILSRLMKKKIVTLNKSKSNKIVLNYEILRKKIIDCLKSQTQNNISLTIFQKIKKLYAFEPDEKLKNHIQDLIKQDVPERKILDAISALILENKVVNIETLSTYFSYDVSIKANQKTDKLKTIKLTKVNWLK